MPPALEEPGVEPLALPNFLKTPCVFPVLCLNACAPKGFSLTPTYNYLMSLPLVTPWEPNHPIPISFHRPPPPYFLVDLTNHHRFSPESFEDSEGPPPLEPSNSSEAGYEADSE